MSVNPHEFFRLVKSAAILVALLTMGLFNSVVSGNSELPDLGENSQINIEYEYKIGGTFYKRLLASGLVETHPLLDRYINDLGSRLLAGLESRLREYRFFIVRDDAVNAFALPGGFIGVNRGLITQSQTQHQLASVLAHEIAHVRLRHGLDMMEKGQEVSNTTLLAMLAGLLLGGIDSEVGAAVLYGSVASGQQAMVNFTRENEYEADRMGVELLKTAGFDANGMAEFFEIIGKLSGNSEIGGIEYLRTHPVSDNRVAEALSRARNQGPVSDQLDDFYLFKDFLRYASTDHLPDTGSEYLRALVAIQTANYDRANLQLTALYEKNPENIWYSIAYAENLEHLGHEEQAELVYRRLLDIFPGDYVLSMRLLKLLKQGGRNRSALVIARDLENRFPQNQQIYFELSEIYLSLKRPALRMMAEAEFHSLNGNPRQAIKLYDEILKSDSADLATESIAREKRLQLLDKKL
jgi:predicted Zn-dependent protease